MFRLALTFSACLMASSALAQVPDQPPPVFARGGQPPRIVAAEGIKDNRLIVREYQYQTKKATRRVPVTKQVKVNGEVQIKTEYVEQEYTYMDIVPIHVEHELGSVEAYDLDAKPVPRDRLASYFSRPSVILLAPDFTSVDPGYLKVARDGVIFIAVRPTVPAKGVEDAPPEPAPPPPPM